MTSCSARSGVRLTINSSRGRSRSKGSSTPRAAPPAPNSSSRRPCTDQPMLATISRTSPMPSVLSPSIAPSSARERVFTAPARMARSLSRWANSKASRLNGTVILRPAPPPSKKLCAACANPSISTRTARYCMDCEHCSANRAWIAGDLLCLTGLPNTAYLSCSVMYCGFHLRLGQPIAVLQVIFSQFRLRGRGLRMIVVLPAHQGRQ